MKFDAAHYPYASRRTTVFAKRGMVATGQPLAAQAGLQILQQGGNAIDAAIASAACLTVVEPTANGIGSDLFAIVHKDGSLYGLNASGPAPQLMSAEAVRKAGYDALPRFGVQPVTVPGAPAGWAELSRRFGRLPLTTVLEPAIAYAEEGFPLSPVLAKSWARAYDVYAKHLKGPEYAAWFATFAPQGRAPKPGEMWRSPHHAATLRAIAETGALSFYQGELAERMEQCFKDFGGYLRAADLAAYRPEWVNPISVSYRGYDIWELPPNGQGLVALMALNMLQHDEFTVKETPATYHRQIEAIKLAFADALEFITDPTHMTVSVEMLLSQAYARSRRELIGDRAGEPTAGSPPRGGTVYLATADADGAMVSLIQSNYMGFGSGIVVPGTGISMQNRGHTFSLDSTRANYLEPGKRTYHTIIPGFVTQNGRAIGPFGVMGGFMQPQGHVQVIMNAIDFHLNPQAALDAPRWQWMKGRAVELERSVPEHVALELKELGHDVHLALDSGGFGRGQIIWRDESGVLAGGTEGRTDGAIAAW